MISVIIPTLNESKTIEYVINFCKSNYRVNEIVVVDDGSTDDSVAIAIRAGAKVITSSMLGKGASMRDGLKVVSNETVIFLDGDLTGLDPQLIERMTTPLLNHEADFVKAKFSRSAGRVTVLTARPLLKIFFPEISIFEQPLGGIIAGKRSCFEKIDFESGYGVDVGILIDVVVSGWRLTEVNIGYLEHDSQSLSALETMAFEVVKTIIDRAHRYGRLVMDHVLEIQEMDRQSQADLAITSNVTSPVNKLALFDMDGTLLAGRYVTELAKHIGCSDQLSKFLDNFELKPEARAREIAKLFKGVPSIVFEEVAQKMPLADGAIETIIALRRQGYRVGIVTDSYWIAASTVMKRVFADFCVAHAMMVFKTAKASGNIKTSPIFRHRNGCDVHDACKLNVLVHLCERFKVHTQSVLACGDGVNDICMLQSAGVSVAVNTGNVDVMRAADFAISGDLRQILSRLTAPVIN